MEKEVIVDKVIYCKSKVYNSEFPDVVQITLFDDTVLEIPIADHWDYEVQRKERRG